MSDMANADSALTVLLVDDNRDLLHFLEREIAEAGWKLLIAETASDAGKLLNSEKVDVALVDHRLPDGNGAALAVQLRQNAPHMWVIVMTDSVLPLEEEAICEEHDFLVLRKPFMASDIMNQIRGLAPARRDFAPEPRMENPFVRDGVLLEILHCLQRIEVKLDLLVHRPPE